jgi:hypothetical protein
MSALLISMEKELSKWKISTTWYGLFYRTARTALIAFSAIVAAQKNLEGSVMGFLVGWVPVLALVVTILTAIDTWQKPQLKWRGFMDDRDSLESLVIRCRDGREDEDKLLKEFEDVRKSHREKHVF